MLGNKLVAILSSLTIVTQAFCLCPLVIVGWRKNKTEGVARKQEDTMSDKKTVTIDVALIGQQAQLIKLWAKSMRH